MLKKTPFYEAHKAMGGRLVDFHGWELPIQFNSIIKEHLAVRSACGVFDVSHMGHVLVEGPGALDFLQKVNANDIGRAGPGKAVYSHMLNPRGGLVDDVIVGCLAPGRYRMVVNAATRDKDLAWLREHASGHDVRLEDASAGAAMLAVQGPAAVKVVGAFAPAAPDLPRFGIMEASLFGGACVVQRTGYTGEDGFEVIAPAESAGRLMEAVMSAGAGLGLVPCGLGSRDTLRFEAGLLLYGTDVDEDHTPFEAGYGWVVKLDKGDFIGRDALLAQKAAGLKRRLTGVRLLEKGVPRPGCPVLVDGRKAGSLASATYSPTFQVGIGAGYLEPADLKPGARASVESHGRLLEAEVAELPFYRAPAPGRA